MICFPNAKINLGLNVVNKRADGYHDLETVFYPVQVQDILEAVPAEQCSLTLTGASLTGEATDNLVMKAHRFLVEELGNERVPPVEIHLHKLIPSGAGMGGGSADAAFMLRLLNDLFQLNLTTEQLQRLAAKLGADCAFFIENKPTYATGIGDCFAPIDLSHLQSCPILIVKPDIFVSTKEAFSLIQPKRPKECVREVCALPVSEWRERLHNDFEDSVFPQFPELATLKERLYKTGADYAAMSGSGSSLFGLFTPSKKDDCLRAKALFPECFTWVGELD
ncbi:MAG: 4-(cytidine 5'-diphospho)-2-C-methyl-D-erythritol kinase [Bacteroidaceae bacterium]|nr:4-(cytidine 5'-diphospho)-2-C-methyl-D-erythritol kinase [Bacteroidaceae bacterium]MBP9637668.1 4-(cytidine 5'-diphospho)-2-C-methyl-D-erythritol kinase [Bacteroidaceae bacterium]